MLIMTIAINIKIKKNIIRKLYEKWENGWWRNEEDKELEQEMLACMHLISNTKWRRCIYIREWVCKLVGENY